MLRTTHDARRTMSSELTHARRQLYERGDHKLRDLAVRLPFLIEDVRHLKSRAHVGWKVGVHRKLRLRLPAVHIGHTRRLARALQTGGVVGHRIPGRRADVRPPAPHFWRPERE